MIRLRKTQLILLTAVVLSACAVAAYWIVVPPREPVVDGESLSFWLDQYNANLTAGGGMRVKAEEAVRQIGTNAIPHLLIMLRVRDAGLKRKLLELLHKQSLIRISYQPAWVQNIEAAQGFEILGTNARHAVPALVDIFERAPSPSSRQFAAEALGGIGPAASPAIPSLIRGATNSDASVRGWAMLALGSIHLDPQTVVSALTKCLNDPVVFNRVAAAQALGLYGPDAKPAIPALKQLLGPTEHNHVRREAAWALKQIDPERGTEDAHE
jgi:HEAT repeat protein